MHKTKREDSKAESLWARQSTESKQRWPIL